MNKQCSKCDIWLDKIYFRIPFTWYFIGKRTPPEAKKRSGKLCLYVKDFHPTEDKRFKGHFYHWKAII